MHRKETEDGEPVLPVFVARDWRSITRDMRVKPPVYISGGPPDWNRPERREIVEELCPRCRRPWKVYKEDLAYGDSIVIECHCGGRVQFAADETEESDG